MTLSDALEFFKKGYKECFNLSDIKKSENHLLHSQWLEDLTDYVTGAHGFEVYAVNKDGNDVPFNVAFNGEESEVSNHFYGVEYQGIFFNLNSSEEYFSSKEEYLSPFKEWNPELTFKIKWF